MVELLGQNHGAIDAGHAADMLRDRKLPGGVFPGDGHRSTLNAFIATHAVVMDLTSGIFWAASPPNQLGKFVAFDVNDFNHELPELTVPADETLASGEFEHLKQSRQFLKAGQRALKEHDLESSLDFAKKAEALNPGFYENAYLEGRVLLAAGKREEAAQAFGRALTEQPAFLKEKQDLEELLRQAKAAN